MELNRPREPADLAPDELALVVVDLQVAYLDGGLLERHRGRLVAAANTLVRWARARGSPVVTVRTEHRRDRSTWTLNMREDDQGFSFDGDPDARFVPELDVVGTHELVKTRDSAFVRTDLAERLAGWGTRALVVCGVSTHTCITFTVAAAYARDLDVFLVTDAVASHRPEWHRSSLDLLHSEYRLPLLTTAEIVGG